MGVLGGLDVAYGSSVQIVRTNVLVAETADAGTAAEYAQTLQIYNDAMMTNSRGGSGLVADFIIGAHAPSDASSVAHPNVIETAMSTGGGAAALPIAGNHANVSSTNAAQLSVLAVLSLGAVEFTTANTAELVTAATAIAGAADIGVTVANGALLAAMEGTAADDAANVGRVSTVNAVGIATDLMTALGNTIDLSGAYSSFVAKGNATGATATTGADITGTVGANSLGMISYTVLAGLSHA